MNSERVSSQPTHMYASILFAEGRDGTHQRIAVLCVCSVYSFHEQRVDSHCLLVPPPVICRGDGKNRRQIVKDVVTVSRIISQCRGVYLTVRGWVLTRYLAQR